MCSGVGRACSGLSPPLQPSVCNSSSQQSTAVSSQQQTAAITADSHTLPGQVQRDIEASALEASARAARNWSGSSKPCGVNQLQPGDELVVTEAALARAARLARDGYLNRAARALEDKPVAPNDEPTWRGLIERHPPLMAPRRHREPQEDWEWIHLNAKEFAKACASMPRSAAKAARRYSCI